MQTVVRRAALLILTAACAASAAWAVWPQPVPVDTASIGSGTLEVTVEDDGVTRVRDVYSISAPISGKMLRSPQKVGDAVVANETVVAVLQPTDPQFLDIRTQRVNQAAVDAAEAAVGLADAQVAQAKSQLVFTQADLRRATELAARQTIAERTLDKARLDNATSEATLASASATLEVRRQELESARARLIQPGQTAASDGVCCIQVKAPVSGRVLRILAESEQVIQAGAPLIEIGDPANLELTVDLLSRDAVRVDAGAPALVENWGGDPLNARVRRIEPAGFTKVSALGIEEQRVKVVLDFTDPRERWERLGHGFRVIVRITVWKKDDVPLVPLSSLFRSGDAWAVFTVVDGRAKRQLVDIAERNLRNARITGGLAGGDRVVLHPSDRVADDVRVAERQADR